MEFNPGLQYGLVPFRIWPYNYFPEIYSVAAIAPLFVLLVIAELHWSEQTSSRRYAFATVHTVYYIVFLFGMCIFIWADVSNTAMGLQRAFTGPDGAPWPTTVPCPQLWKDPIFLPTF
jgi:hypothetical protein